MVPEFQDLHATIDISNGVANYLWQKKDKKNDVRKELAMVKTPPLNLQLQ